MQPTLKPWLIPNGRIFKNSGLFVILHYLDSFQHKNYVAFSLLYVLFRKNHKINGVCFPSFHNGCKSACKLWRRLRSGEYIITKYKVSDCSKLRPDLPNMFLASSQWNQQIFRPSYFWLHVITWAVFTLWQHCCKTQCSLKNICYRVRICCNSNFKIFKWKVNINAVYSDVYSAAEGFPHWRTGYYIGAFKLFS